MARRLSSQSRSAYTCPPKTCPHPADFVGLAAVIHTYVRRAYTARMIAAATGANAAARRAAKATGHGRCRKKGGSQSR